MDIRNYMWLGKHQKVVVAFNQLLDVLKALASVVLFTKVVSLNHGAHSAINNHDALVKYVSYAAVDWHFLNSYSLCCLLLANLIEKLIRWQIN